MTDYTHLRMSVLVASFTALITVGAFISVPLPFTPVPIVLQNFFVMLAALLLGWKWSALSVALYLLLGAVGLPVFSAARGGLGHFFGPTGGYLIGFLACALLAGALRRPQRSPLHNLPAALVGFLAIYAVGVPWLKQVSQMSWTAALSAGVVPFLIGDAVKLAAALAAQRVVTARIPWLSEPRRAVGVPE
jgi:biotin transport system substrate-specific component